MSAGGPYDPYAPAETPPPQPQQAYLPIPISRPLWTYVLIAINVAIWLGVTLTTSDPRTGEGLILNLFIKDDVLIAHGEIWRLLTAAFLHQEPLHIGFNMLALYALGPQVESTFGPRRFVIIYLLSGLMGNALSFWLSPDLSLGASGAIFGIFGALLPYLVRNRHGFGEIGRRRLTNLLVVIGINIVFTLSVPYIDLWGHLGGLSAGLALGWALTPVYRVDRDNLWGAPRVIDAGSPSLRVVVTSVVVLVFVAIVALGTFRWR